MPVDRVDGSWGVIDSNDFNLFTRCFRKLFREDRVHLLGVRCRGKSEGKDKCRENELLHVIHRFCPFGGVLRYPMEDPKSKEISWQRPFNTYFLFIVRSRNSCINDPIRSTSSSNAKWPVSRRWSSALGISLLKSSAPSTVKIPSFSPQAISMGGCCLRKYSC